MAALVALRRRGLVGADNTVADDSGLNADDIPDDAVVALHLLREQFPPSAGAGGLHPVALVSQIYSLVPDRTAVDRQLDQAMRRQEVRLFRWVCARLVPALCLPRRRMRQRHAEVPTQADRLRNRQDGWARHGQSGDGSRRL